MNRDRLLDDREGGIVRDADGDRERAGRVAGTSRKRESSSSTVFVGFPVHRSRQIAGHGEVSLRWISARLDFERVVRVADDIHIVRSEKLELLFHLQSQAQRGWCERIGDRDVDRVLAARASCRIPGEIQRRQRGSVVDDAVGQEAVDFRGDRGTPLKQDTYLIEHNKLGAFSFLIVPVKTSDENAPYYEAVINRLYP